MKNIVFVIESLHCGGAEKSLVTLLQNLDFSKYNVDLIVTIDNGDFQKFVPKEVNIQVVDIFSPLSKAKKMMLRASFYLRKKFDKNKSYHPAQLYWKNFNKIIKKISKTYDIAIAYNQGFSTYFIAEKVTSKVKYAWLNIDYKKAGYNINYDIDKYLSFNKVIPVSKEAEESFFNELQLINSKPIETEVIKDITDPLIVNKLGDEHIGVTKTPGVLNICSVGRLAHQKGWHLAIEALYNLKNKGHNIKWYIIGEGPQRKEIEAGIKEKGLEQDLILVGYKENPYPYVKSCDIYVQTSLFEGLGLTVIEASILLKPIVTTNFPTASTIVTHEETGLICEMTPESISKAIESYIEDSSLMEKVITNLSKADNNDKAISLSKVENLLNAN